METFVLFLIGGNMNPKRFLKSITYLLEMVKHRQAESVQEKQVPLSLSRKQANRLEPIDLNVLTKDVEQYLRPRISKHNGLYLKLTSKRCDAMAGHNQVEQVLMNLAAKVQDAMPDGCAITIGSEVVKLSDRLKKTCDGMKEGWYAELTFSDTGSGMDEGTKQRIFESFFTTEDTEKGAEPGFSNIHDIVKQHNGIIAIDNEPGKGTSFKIYIPIAVPEVIDIPSDNPAHFSCGSWLRGITP